MTPDDNEVQYLEIGIGPDQADPYGGFGPDWHRDPKQLSRAALRTLWWTFVPHKHNSDTRKIVTSVLMLTWAFITVGKAFGFAETGTYYPYLSLLVFAIVSTIWGFELGMLETSTALKIRDHYEEEEDDR